MMQYCCPGCGYIYDEARGDAHQGFAPGTAWANIPAHWPCPDCVVTEKEDFQRVNLDEKTVAARRTATG
jgi:rubredoxin